jgi:hypothetical protein
LLKLVKLNVRIIRILGKGNLRQVKLLTEFVNLVVKSPRFLRV